MTLEQLRLEIANRLLELEDFLVANGLPMSQLTLIARDPNNDEMYVCISSETPEGIIRACELALKGNVK